MAILDGYVFKQDFKTVSIQQIGTTPVALLEADFIDCCSDDELLVLIDNINFADKNKNDRTGHIFNLNPLTNSATLTLEKEDHITGMWSSVGALTGNNVGTFYGLNFYQNVYGERYIGYQLDWNLVFNVYGLGYGRYRVKCTYNTLTSSNNVVYSYKYNLMPYSSATAQGTVRFEYYSNRLITDTTNDKVFFDYSTLNWFNSIRIKGIFGYPQQTLKATYITYTNNRRQLPAEIELKQEYEFNTKSVKSFIHNIFKEMIFADEIFVNDYDKMNPESYINKEVIVTGFDNEWFRGTSRKGIVNMKFGKRYQNNIKRWA